MADDPRVESGPLPADKPHGQEVSNTLQVYLLIFTLVFVLILAYGVYRVINVSTERNRKLMEKKRLKEEKQNKKKK
jgi:flagellar biogenesis protein FliO